MNFLLNSLCLLLNISFSLIIFLPSNWISFNNKSLSKVLIKIPSFVIEIISPGSLSSVVSCVNLEFNTFTILLSSVVNAPGLGDKPLIRLWIFLEEIFQLIISSSLFIL